MELLQNASTIQTAAFGITNSGNFYNKLRHLVYYKTVQLLLQNMTAVTKRGIFITKYGSYYKTGHLLQKGL